MGLPTPSVSVLDGPAGFSSPPAGSAGAISALVFAKTLLVAPLLAVVRAMQAVMSDGAHAGPPARLSCPSRRRFP